MLRAWGIIGSELSTPQRLTHKGKIGEDWGNAGGREGFKKKKTEREQVDASMNMSGGKF
jgi:hypothetical protein